MTNADTSLRLVRLLSAAVANAALLAACSPGGGSDPVPTPPPPPASVTITGKAVDGALLGATACYDLNDNGACDSGEPTSASTDASGAFSLDVAASEAGRHRVVVDVPATAIDADTGAAVGRRFAMMAPASGSAGAQSVFVSPLSTLVQQHADRSGLTVAQAASFVQAQLGLALSPLADFTAGASAANATAALAARLLRLTQVQQAAAVAAAVGQTDLSGGKVTDGDVDKAVMQAVTEALPAIGASAADPALRAASGAAREAALGTAAASVVAGTGLSADDVVAAVGIGKLPADTAAATPEASAVMAALQYTDNANWFMRVNQASALDNTPDSSGLVHYFDVRTRMQPYAFQNTLGVAESFAIGTTKERAGDLHWNGSAWVACTLGQRNAQTPRDAKGRSIYNACDNYFKGVTTRAALDIGGQGMAAVFSGKILPLVGPTSTTGGGGGNGWSLNTAVLGAATFPAGSKLFLQTDLSTDNAPAYDVRPLNQVAVFSAAVAAGGDARSGTVACQTTGTAVATTSLEEMIARNPGKPCVFATQTNADGSSLNPSEAWGPSSLSLGDLPGFYASQPAGTGNYYTRAGALRVAFTGSGDGTTYYRCYRRRADNSARNCTSIGTGTYTVTTLGDARVMSFNNLPAAAQQLGFARLFVERGGTVYFGFRNAAGGTANQVRLNLAAAQALTIQLGLPRIQPADAPKALTGGKAATAATLKGVWGGANASGALIFRFGDNGEFLMADIGAPGDGGRPGLEKGWLDFDPATGQRGALLAIDSNGQWGTSHPMAGEGITSVTPTAINYVGGSIPRFVDDPAGIVGMWAVGSATSLSAPHFVFFASGRVASIHPYSAGDSEPGGACDVARQGPPGIEWSDYTFNAATGALRIFNKIYDTNGCTGIFDSSDGAVIAGTANTEANFVVTFAPDRKTATTPGDSGLVTLYRIATQ